MNATFQLLQSRLNAALQDLDDTQTQLRPVARPDSWSIQQIVEHLLLTYRSTETYFEARIAKGRPTLATPSLWQRVSHGAVFSLGYFPQGRKAPQDVAPIDSPARSAKELKAAIYDQLHRLDQISETAESLFGAKGRLTHQVLGPLTLQQWRQFHLAHGTHHIKQIIAIRRDHQL
jgi:hypothetical protein